MSTRESSRVTKSRQRKRKHNKHQQNIKPSHAKKKSLKLKENHDAYIPKRPTAISKNTKKLNNKSFYKQNPALIETKIDGLYPSGSWYQSVYQSSSSWAEELRIRVQVDPTTKDHSLSHHKNAKTSEQKLWKMLTKAQTDYKRIIHELLKPYLSIAFVTDIILLYNGPHLLPIRYSVDLLPYLYSTVRTPRARQSLWTNADKNTITGDCTVDMKPKQDIIVVEDIYDNWISYIKKKLSLRPAFDEEAMFYIPSGDAFMGIRVSSNSTKTAFTHLYIEALGKFERNKEYAFRMDLAGINYRYYCRTRTSSPSWGSRSRCWDGAGMVLLNDGTKKPVRDLNVGDVVAVLDSLPNGVSTGCRTATVKVRIESVVNREYEMVLVNERLWITPYHAVLNTNANEWKMPCHLSKIEERFEGSVFNFILDRGHVLNVNDVWACTLGHDFRGEVIENPIWGSSQVMHDMWSKMEGYPNVVEYI